MTTPASARTVAVLGLGQMGEALALALRNAGFAVAAWNRTAAKGAAVAAAGARLAATPADAVAGAQLVVVCVKDHAATKDVVMTTAMAAALKGTTLVQSTTAAVDEAKALAAWCGDAGIGYLDGTILGYPGDILAGRCTVVYSGPQALYDADRAAFQAMGGKPLYAGPTIGAAPAFSRAINAYSFAGWLGFFHGAALCQKAGFPIETFVEVAIDMLPSRVEAMRLFGGHMAARDYSKHQAALERYAHAYDRAVDLTRASGIDPDLAETVQRAFRRAMDAGRGEEALSVLFEQMIAPDGPPGGKR